MMKSCTPIAATLLLALANVIPSAAQTPAPSTCATAPTGLTALNFERGVTLPNILTTLTPNLPANVLASIASGAQEIREKMIFNAQLNTVTSTVFLVAAGAPLPTPNFDFQTGVIQSQTLKISQILSSCTPVPSVLIVGTITDGPPTGAFGSLKGAPAAISIGFSTDTATTPATPVSGQLRAHDTLEATQITNVVEVVAGLVTAYSPAGTGTLTFPSVPVIPPGSTGNITINVTSQGIGTLTNSPTAIVQVHQNPIVLDASTSVGTGPLTFAWTSPNSPVNFSGTGNAGQIMVTFPSKGDFKILLTVTDTTTGASQTFTVIFEFS